MTSGKGFQRKWIRQNENAHSMLDSSPKLVSAINRNCEIYQNTHVMIQREKAPLSTILITQNQTAHKSLSCNALEKQL